MASAFNSCSYSVKLHRLVCTEKGNKGRHDSNDVTRIAFLYFKLIMVT